MGNEEVWNNFKNIILESIERFIPDKIPRKNSDPEYYNKEVRKSKSKVRKAYCDVRPESRNTGTRVAVHC
jgi:hypothetical protein